MDSASPPPLRISSAAAYAFNASSDDVVASVTGVSNFWIDASDSPNFPRRLDAAFPTAGSTASLLGAVTCSRASESPVAQLVASSATTYWLPSVAIEPISMALRCSRLQISRATLPVTRSSAPRPMNCSALRIVGSGTMFKYGDCSSCTASACFSVPSNTGSPVVLTKSASRMESFSVSVGADRDRQYNPPAIIASKRTPAAAHAHVGTDARGCPAERGSVCPSGADTPVRAADTGTGPDELLDRCVNG